MKKKGFTLIELLTVIVILGILLGFAIPNIHSYLIRGTDEYYSSLEDTVLLAGRDYLNDYRALLPKEIGNVTVIELSELTSNNYINDIVDSEENSCEAQVTAKKTGKNEYEYYTCLICPSYQSEESNCNYDENENVTVDSKNYRIEVEKDTYTVNQGDAFELPLGKVYYTSNGKESLINEELVGKPKTIDTSILGETTVRYVYQGAAKDIKVEVIDIVDPTTPKVVLRKNTSAGRNYIGGWFSGNIYQEYSSTDYSKEGILGSGINYYEISNDGNTFTRLNHNYRIDSINGNYDYYVRSVDKSGNTSESTMYNLKIDKEIPSCSLTTTGTSGNSGWFISDATTTFSSIIEEVSSISSQRIDSASTTSDIKEKKVTGTVIDEAGNTGLCTTSVSVDKTNPTVSYNVVGGVYNSNKNVTVTASDTFFSYMNNHVYKDGTITTANNNVTSKTSTFSLTHGVWTIYTQAYDESGRRQNQSPDNGGGWYYQTYTIDTKAPTCSLKVTSGTLGSNGWYTTNVGIGWNSSDGTGSSIVSSSISSTSLTSEGTHTVTGTVTDGAGNVGTCSITVKIEKTVSTPSVSYNGGSNTCTWKNNYNMNLSSSSQSGIAYYEIDWNSDGVADTTTGSNFIPWNGYSSCATRFRAVSNAGNRSSWSGNHHIHMDTEKPAHTNWWWGEVTKDVARLYIQTTDNVGVQRVQCPTSTATGGYNNWVWFNAVWDASANAYRCDITPATFAHYNQTYSTHLYIYDHAGNGGYYNATSVAIPATCPYNAGQIWNFNYTGGGQGFTIPCSGTYKLELWGAQGGNYSTFTGGAGGLVQSNYSLNTGDQLNVYVGGAGSGTTGGTNGLGSIGASSASNGAGGGASSVFHLIRNNSTSTLLIAGGGGGASAFYAGGVGGNTANLNSNGNGVYGVGGGGGGNLGGVGGQAISNIQDYIWIPDMVTPNKQYNIDTSKVSGQYSRAYGPSGTYGYTEGVNGVYSYMQILGTGGIHEVFTGYANTSEGQGLRFNAIMDVQSPADYDGNQSYVEYVDQNGTPLYRLTFQQIKDGVDYGNNNRSSYYYGPRDTGIYYGNYTFDVSFSIPAGVTKIGFRIHCVSVMPSNNAANSGIYVVRFGLSTLGNKAYGGSNYINTNFGASSWASYAGQRSGNGTAKITLISAS